MLIKCLKCGHENMLGAIFCRNCGEKLDIEKMRPEIRNTNKRSGGLMGFIRRLLGLIIFLALVGILVALFIPEQIVLPELAPDAKAVADKKFTDIMNRVDEGFGNDKYTLSPEEICYIYNSKLITPAEGGGAATYDIEALSFSIDSLGYIHCALKTKLGGKVPATFEIKGALVGEPPIRLDIVEAKMGKMPIKFVESKIAEKFDVALNDPRLAKIISAISKAELTEDKKISITIKEKTL